MNTTTTQRRLRVIAMLGCWSVAAGQAPAQECSNQAIVDGCKLGCTAAEGLCDFVCNAGLTACKGICTGTYETCDAGCDLCDTGCDGCCLVDCGYPGGCSDCRDECDSCHSGCTTARNSCNSGCDGDCSGCKLPCEADCDALCIPFKKIGESCIPGIEPCASGAVCWPNSFEDSGNVFQCFPSEGEVIPTDACIDMFSPEIAEAAIAGGTLSFGTGGSASVGISDVLEVGVAYAADGCYGCYVSSCIGLETNIQASVYATVGGWLVNLDGFQGQSRLIVESAGVELISTAFGQVLSFPAFDIIGATETLSFGVGIVPISAGFYDCETAINEVGCYVDGELQVSNTNNAPVAQCQHAEVCMDQNTCTASVDIDAGSFDVDGDTLTKSQSPARPYGFGDTNVTLTASDPGGLSDTCDAVVTVLDCQAPILTCPQPQIVECQSNLQAPATVAPPQVQDCTTTLTSGYGTASYPLGTTSVTLSGIDQQENMSTCVTAVTVQDTIAPNITCPADLTIECDASIEPADTGMASASDTCDPNLFLSHSDSEAIGSCPQESTITRTWTATDGSGNSTSCTQLINRIDTTAPVAACGAAEVTISCGDPVPAFEPTAIDNCDPNPDGVTDNSESYTACLADPVEYTITRTFDAEDACGNASDCGQLVTVLKRTAQLDILPSCCHNHFRLQSEGLVRLTLFGDDDFDVESIDLTTLRISRADCTAAELEPYRVQVRDRGAPLGDAGCMCHSNIPDGAWDLDLRFRKQDLIEVLDLGDMLHGDTVELTVSGELDDGCPFVANDCITRPLRRAEDGDRDDRDECSDGADLE